MILKWTAATILVAAALCTGLIFYGRWRWEAATAGLVTRLESSRHTVVQPASRATRFDPRELDTLPAVVRRYFATVLLPGQPMVKTVSIQHRGSFNLSENGEQWKPFTSYQRVATDAPGFVWDARIFMLPGLAVHVHDAYVAGEGILHPAVAGLFSMMDLREGGELARGELLRYFAEMAWYPTALLPSQGVRWEAADDRSARATLTDGGLTVALTFTFSDDGTIERLRAEARGRGTGADMVPTPWEGHWSDYQRHDGMLVPMQGEVAWILPGGPRTYWRGSIESLQYEYESTDSLPPAPPRK